MNGYLVISLDFELLWGVRDKRGIADYGDAILGARRAVPMILSMFALEGIRATWACVGLLFFRNRRELLGGLPDVRPNYTEKRLDPYAALERTIGASEEDDPYHYGASLIERITDTIGQEIGTHTFSHYYCLEKGQCLSSFAADLDAAVSIARSRGLSLRSIVFPRNQMTADHIAVSARFGISGYRGNPKGSIYNSAAANGQTLSRRLRRYADSFVGLSGKQTSVLRPSRTVPCNIPASRFLRPNVSLQVLNRLRLTRIMTEMTHAAATGGLYHLWWHPHNFGRRTEANMHDLQSVIRHFQALRLRYGMESVTMGDLAARKLTAAS